MKSLKTFYESFIVPFFPLHPLLHFVHRLSTSINSLTSVSVRIACSVVKIAARFARAVSWYVEEDEREYVHGGIPEYENMIGVCAA